MLVVRWQNVVDFVVLVGAIYLLLRWGKEARAFRVSVAIVSLKAAGLLARQLDLIVTSLVLDATNLIAIILLLIVYQLERSSMNRYTLPDLPYDYSALEPHISGKIMELHHGKHHAGYVKNANSVLEQLDEARHKDDFARLASLERALAFNLSGHILHSIFWKNMTPKGGGTPHGDFAGAIQNDFGGFQQFRKQLSEVASTIMGSGWAALVWEPIGKKLLITQIYDHQSNLAQAGVPLMVADAWEHAYYLQYENRKTEFFKALWELWNWQDISARYASALQLQIDIGKAA